MPPQKKFTVVIDTREQNPLLFPPQLVLRGIRRDIKTRKKKCPAGDYYLEGYKKTCIVERKASVRELQKNLTDSKDRRRFKRATDALLKATDNPVIAVEGSVSALLTPTRHVRKPGHIIQKLLDMCVSRGIQVWFVGRCKSPTARRRAGELILRGLLAQAK